MWRQNYPVVTEYPLHHLLCPMCGVATRIPPARWWANEGFGPRLQAIAAWCTWAYHHNLPYVESHPDYDLGIDMCIKLSIIAILSFNYMHLLLTISL
jgi:hypothetical protein